MGLEQSKKDSRLRQGLRSESVYLYVTHFVSKEILREFKKIQNAEGATGRSFILYNQRGGAPAAKEILNLPHVLFDDLSFSTLGDARAFRSPIDSVSPSNITLALVQFYREHHYPYYWYIENDVRFTGDWRILFNYFEKDDADLLTSHIRRHRHEPDYPFWSTLTHPTEVVEPSDLLRSFNTLYRISWEALKYIDEMYSQGWMGHNEVLLPTLLSRGGFRLKDFGGIGEFVPPQDRNRFYVDQDSLALHGCSNRYTSPYWWLFQPKQNKIYHPVKSERNRGVLFYLFYARKIQRRVKILWSALKNFFIQRFKIN